MAHEESDKRSDEDRRPPFVLKMYRDKEDRYPLEVGAAWRVGKSGLRIVIHPGIAVLPQGRLILWKREDK